LPSPHHDVTLTVHFHLDSDHRGVSASRVALVVLVGCVVSVAACGGGGDPTGALTDAFDGVDADVPQPDRVEPDHAESGGTPVEVRPPEFFLTGSLDAPAGTVLDPANCGRPDDSGPPYFEYYVPADWIVRSSGYGGAGGVTGGGSHSYERPDGTTLHLEIETDSYLDTEPLDGNGAPWTTWDYDITSYTDDGEETTRITYDAAGQVDIDGESFDLYALDQAQSDILSASEYKVRIVFAEVPTGRPDGYDRRPESAEVTVSWNATNGDVTVQEVHDLLSTFRLAQCAQDGLTDLYGMLTGTDFSSSPATGQGD